MNILLCTDNSYIQHCGTTIVSVLRNNKNVSVYIFSTDITEESKQILRALVESYYSTIEFILIENELIRDFPMSKEASNHISLATYFRLFVEVKLPGSVDKILYLDSDIIVRHSLKELWETNIENYALAAVYQYNEWALGNETFKRLNYPEDAGYFNAGVLLINLKYWRNNDVSQRLLSFINRFYENIVSHDQDTLNAVLFKEVYPLECNWNFLPFFLEETLSGYSFPRNLQYKKQVKENIADPSIIHFVYKPKPWEYGCTHVWRSEYYYYLNFTPWKGWKPQFNFNSFLINIFIPKLLSYRRMVLNVIKNNK
jgi:lipopolysaccharide biosynthesis glycosyltransferase